MMNKEDNLRQQLLQSNYIGKARTAAADCLFEAECRGSAHPGGCYNIPPSIRFLASHNTGMIAP